MTIKFYKLRVLQKHEASVIYGYGREGNIVRGIIIIIVELFTSITGK